MRPSRIPLLFSGGGTPWTPADLSPHSWWRADTGISTDVDGVYEWTDKSGNSHKLQQPTGANKPDFVASHAPLGGEPAIDFDGINDVLYTDLFTKITMPNTIWVVADLDTAGGGAYRFLTDGGEAADRHAIYVHTTGGPWTYFCGGANVGTTASDTDPHYFVARFENSAVNAYLRMDGAELENFNPGDQDLTQLLVGTSIGVANPLDGKVAEVGIVDGALSGANLTFLESYAAARYGIT